MHMPEHEVLHTRIGKLNDLIACHYIAHGAEPAMADDDAAIPDVP